MTLPHFACSLLMRSPNSSGVLAMALKPSASSFSFTSARTMSRRVAARSDAMMLFGVPAGTTMAVSVSPS